MRKKLITVLLVVLLALAVGIALVSCGGGDSNSNTGNTNKTEDKDKSADVAGWKAMGSLDQKEMYKTMLLGFTNIAQEFSKTKAAGKAVTFDGTAGLKLNGNNLNLSLKAKYDGTDSFSIQHKTIVGMQLSSEDTSGNLIEAYIYNPYIYNPDDDHYYLYLSLGKNKVRFSLENSQLLSFFPFDLPDISSKISEISNVLPQYIVLKSVEGKSRLNSNKDEYQYTLDVDVSKTFVGLSIALSDKTIFKDQLQVLKIKTFVADLLNISVDQLERGEVSDSSLKLYFLISGNKIQTTDVSVNMALGKGAQNLIGTDTLDLNIHIDDVTVTNDYGNGTVISYVNNTKVMKSYIKYSDAIYYLQVPVKLFDGNYQVKSENHLIRVTTRIFQDNREENFFLCEYYDKTQGKVDKAVYVYDDIAYVYMLVDGEETCVYTFDLDLSTLATAIVTNTLKSNKYDATQPDIYALVAYVFKNISLSKHDVSFAIDNEFFTSVWFNFNDMVEYLNRIAPDDFDQMDEINRFINELTTTNVILTIGYSDDNLLTMLTMNDEPLKSTVEKIKAVTAANESEEEQNNDVQQEEE